MGNEKLEKFYDIIKKEYEGLWRKKNEMEEIIFYHFIFVAIAADMAMEGKFPEEFWNNRSAEILTNWGNKNYKDIMAKRQERLEEYMQSYRIISQTKYMREGELANEDLEIIFSFSKRVLNYIEGLSAVEVSSEPERAIGIVNKILRLYGNYLLIEYPVEGQNII